jgi:hypothetical protein
VCHLDERDVKELVKMRLTSAERGDPRPPDTSHSDACPVLIFEDPKISQLLAQYMDYSSHGCLLRAPAVIEAQPNWWYEAMQEIGAEWGRRMRAERG